MLKQALGWLWDTIPFYIKWPMVLVTVPSIPVILFVWWNLGDLKATVVKNEEMRDLQIKNLEERHVLEMSHIKEGISTLNQQQSLMFQEMLRRRNP